MFCSGMCALGQQGWAYGYVAGPQPPAYGNIPEALYVLGVYQYKINIYQ